jgi:hypothetical protein
MNANPSLAEQALPIFIGVGHEVLNTLGARFGKKVFENVLAY